eukprot:10216249-Karenia_brevis.AAC.1
MPNGELLVRHNLNMPEYKMPEQWRVQFRKCDMMPNVVLNPTVYDAQFPFVCGMFQEALVASHAPGYHNSWYRKVTDENLPD